VKLRNCAWVDSPAHTDEAPSRIVWARGETISKRCPKSIITADSLYFLAQFQLWKETAEGLSGMDAKSADAVLLLEREWQMEEENGKV
jgi:hypothetical protein